MCVGPLAPPRPPTPAPPPRLKPAPSLRTPAPPPQMASPEKIRDEDVSEEKLSTRKKKALEVQKAQRGVKEFGAINPAATPETPPGGVQTPGL